MKLQGLLFDIDGTLVDSNDLHVRCWLDAFEHFGKTFAPEVIHDQIGKGGDLLIPDLLQARDIRRLGDDLKKYRSKLYREKFMPEVKPFPFAKNLLASLHERGVKLALASSSDAEEVEYYTRLLGAEKWIAGSTSKGDAKHSKPSPEIFDAALERAGSDPEFTFVVGDTPYDILAAHRCAIPIVAVLSGGFARETLAKAEFVFDHAGQILERTDEIDAWFE